MLGLVVALSIAIGFHLYWLITLYGWLHGRRMRQLPEGSGLWPEVFANINYIRGRTKRRGKRFKALLKQMRQATRSFPDGGVILGAENEIITLNHIAADMLGLKGKQDRGMRIENLIRNPEFVDYLRAEDRSMAVEITSPANPSRWLSCLIVPYGLEQQLLLVRDITRERRADLMRRDFVANASHELRTPLTVITGYLEALGEEQGLSDELRRPIHEMQRQSERMRRLVDELLRLSELESEGLAPESDRVSIAAVMETAKQEAMAIKGCPRTIDIDLQSSADLLGAENDVQSIVSNLLTNAVRYTGEDGRITLRWEVDDEGGHLAVTDTGVGIAAEHIPRLTERFYRVENGRERVGGDGGNGLGLAIVKHALYRHSASMDIDSELGVGSRFTCHFPKNRITSVS